MRKLIVAELISRYVRGGEVRTGTFADSAVAN